MEDVTCNLSSSLFTVNDPDPQYVWIPLTILLHRSGFTAESLEVSHEVVNLVNAHSYRSDCFQCSCSSEYLDFNMYIRMLHFSLMVKKVILFGLCLRFETITQACSGSTCMISTLGLLTMVSPYVFHRPNSSESFEWHLLKSKSQITVYVCFFHT